jgi:hypothetical protein
MRIGRGLLSGTVLELFLIFSVKGGGMLVLRMYRFQSRLRIYV